MPRPTETKSVRIDELENVDAPAFQLTGAGDIAGINTAACELYGFEPRHVVDQPVSDVLRSRAGALPWAERLANADGWRGIDDHVRENNPHVWVRVELVARDDDVLLLVTPASGSEVCSAQQGPLVDHLGAALAKAGLGVWIDDRLFGRLDWSPRAREVFGFTPEESVDHERFFQHIHPDDRAPFGAAIQRTVVDRSVLDTTLRVAAGDGSYRHVRTVGLGVHTDGGELLCGIGVCEDIEDRVQLTARVGELEQQLQHAQKMEAVGRLASGIAHDFNNLLTTILCNAELIATSTLDDQSRQSTEDIRSAVTRAAELTQQLLAYSRKQPMSLRVVSLDILVDRSQRLLQRLVGEMVEIEFDGGADEAHVRLDPAQLHQVLTNLVINGAHAMPTGGTVRISTHVTDIDKPEHRGQYAVLSVHDTGSGIDDETLARIFEPFFTTKGVGDGTGLGLATVQGITEQLGGFVDVRTEVGRGSTFFVNLPTVEEELDAVTDQPAPSRLPLDGRTVLLVEDDIMIRTIVRRLLEQEGVNVILAATGAEALSLCGTKMNHELVITDVVMPHMSGPQLVAQLRARGDQSPVLFMSGYPAEIINSRVVMGAHESLLHKPFTRDRLFESLRELLSR